ncbi:hypothetical protein ITX44_39060 [Streptomyces sp. KK5PA1]|uniref:Phage protein n=1 Tax=Actinacidiphila acididurans TaxID=2784346 RepID=A0ABS2U4C3_9ACTN|nr:hypothetical protein [Actinacidiphila acididurans]
MPYVVRWSGEQDGAVPVVVRRDRRGIGYGDERAFDRDERGVLWSRTPSEPGRGRPEFGKVHSLRQRLAMAGLRCQVCGGPADRTADGALWLIDARDDELLSEREETFHPPLCRPCAHRSVRACPHLRSGVIPVRVRAFAPSGVSGVLYAPAGLTAQPVETGTFRFGDPRLPWVRAHQLLMQLADFFVVDLDDLDT